MALPSSGSAADLIATAAATREQAALDAFDTLSRTSSVGRAELALALLQVSEAALATAVQRGTSSPLLTSPRKRDATKQQLDEFLLARGQSGCPATFDDFVALYNDYVDFFDTERSPASKRPPGSRANVANINETDPRVLSMAHNINARMSQARSEGRSTISPMGERSSNRSGPTRMSLVSSSAEAPQIDPDESFSKSETFDRRRRFSVPGEASPSPVPQESPGISPEFFRAGTRKYDYTSDTDRKSARDSYSQRRASGNFSPGGSPSMCFPATLQPCNPLPSVSNPEARGGEPGAVRDERCGLHYGALYLPVQSSGAEFECVGERRRAEQRGCADFIYVSRDKR